MSQSFFHLLMWQSGNKILSTPAPEILTSHLLVGHFNKIIITDHDNVLSQGPLHDGEINIINNHNPVYLYLDTRRRDIGFIIPYNDTICILDQNIQRPFQPVWISAACIEGCVTLKDPMSGQFYSNKPEFNALPANVTSAHEWECFVPLAGVPAPEQVKATARLCQKIIDGLTSPASAIDLIKDKNHPTSAILETFLTLLPNNLAEILCWKLLADVSSPTEGWPTQLQNEPWFSEACWALKTRKSTQRRIDKEFDFLGTGYGTTSYRAWSPAHRFLRHARRRIHPTKELALLGTARDEGLYILEWIAHHRCIGVEHIFLYSNNNTDGSDELLKALDTAGIITWFDNSPALDAGKINLQDKAYGHALGIMPEILDYKWTLVVDLDEYVLPSPLWNNDLRPILRMHEAQGADSISFPWQVFYTSQHLTWTDDLLGKRYTHSGPHPLVKSAFLTNRFAFSAAHHPYDYPDETRCWLTADGQEHSHERHSLHHPVHNAVVCHYAVRSLEEYVWKYARGENDGSGVLHHKTFRFNTPDVVTRYPDYYENNTGTPDNRYNNIFPAVENEIRNLLSLPGVRTAKDNIIKNYQKQITPLVKDSVSIVDKREDITFEQKQKWANLVARWSALKASPQ
ncbi:glycosyltransferase family 2 protein [Neokomagataea thailandica]|nr:MULTISPECIES: glycosyltransferase family 2 protein [Neokomagataea]